MAIDIIGHRGARGAMPENTLKGFDYLLSLGVHAVELDVLMTRDDVIVVTHNPTLGSETTRKPDGSWVEGEGPAVSSLTFEELQTFDVGGIRPDCDYGRRFADQAFLSNVRVPSFDDMMMRFLEEAKGDARFLLEIKSNPFDDGERARARDAVEGVISRIKRWGIGDQVYIQSFDWTLLSLAAELAPNIKRSFLSLYGKDCKDDGLGSEGTVFSGSPWIGDADYDGCNGSGPAMIAKAGGAAWAPYFTEIDENDVAEAHAAGLSVNVWTVNQVEDIHKMIDLGVDGIISDYPARVQRVFNARGLI